MQRYDKTPSPTPESLLIKRGKIVNLKKAVDSPAFESRKHFYKSYNLMTAKNQFILKKDEVLGV